MVVRPADPQQVKRVAPVVGVFGPLNYPNPGITKRQISGTRLGLRGIVPRTR